MTELILIGDALEKLKEIEDKTVDCCVTSPPYWGLRDYQTAKWEGGDIGCDHVANTRATKKFGNDVFNENRPSREETKTKGYYADVCPKCGAIKKDLQIGLEGTPEAYINRLVAVFREVKRVLKDDATLWVNIGDSYANQKSGDTYSGFNDRYFGKETDGGKQAQTVSNAHIGKLDFQDCKPKDLVGIPWMLAFALRFDGWYLRQDLIWAKPNPMPESVRDRCTKSHEYIFLLSKSPSYYYDACAIKEPVKNMGKPRAFSKPGNNDRNDVGRIYEPRETRNKRSVWFISTKPYKGAHFATFPPDLIEPCILAGSREGGIVLDPFMGSGVTCMVAKKHGRGYIGVDLNPSYTELAKKRIYEGTKDGLQLTMSGLAV